jgi:hypothetical protein
MSQTIFSRWGLATIIHTFSLYKTERSRMPMEDVVELMRKSILIRPVASVVDGSPRIPAFVVQFSYEDRHLAQRVTQELVGQYIDDNLREASAALPINLELIDPASLPLNPVSPRPSAMIAMGLAVGPALGAAGAYVRHATRSMPV